MRTYPAAGALPGTLDGGSPTRSWLGSLLAPTTLKDKFRLVGNLETELELACSRCLEPYRFPLSAPFDLRYLPASSAVFAEGEHELDEDDLEISYYRDDQIDLNDLLREQFYLALPMKPLCREDCRGLCPECGIDRNEESCDWTLREPDPRWQALRDLEERTADE